MKRLFFVSILIVLIFSGNIFAGRMWFYSEVTDSHGIQIGWGNTAISMRSGNSWPVVAYSDGMPNSGVAAMLPGAWAKGPVSFTGQYLDGATAPDGTVAFVDNAGQVAMLGKTGWSSSSYSSNVQSGYKSSIAFNNNSSPGVLYKSADNYLTLSVKSGNAWYSGTVQEPDNMPVYAEAFAFDFDSYNQANVAFRDGDGLRYATKGVLTGNQWVVSSYEESPFIGFGNLDMALTNNDVPYVLYNNNNFLGCAVYDKQSNLWTTSVLDSLFNTGPISNFCVTADLAGGIGVAYVADLAGIPVLSYAYNNGSGWMGLERLAEARADLMVGLAFDYENNPVISFVDWNDGGMKIAYDPVVAPEPATLAIIALGFALIRRK